MVRSHTETKEREMLIAIIFFVAAVVSMVFSARMTHGYAQTALDPNCTYRQAKKAAKSAAAAVTFGIIAIFLFGASCMSLLHF